MAQSLFFELLTPTVHLHQLALLQAFICWTCWVIAWWMQVQGNGQCYIWQAFHSAFELATFFQFGKTYFSNIHGFSRVSNKIKLLHAHTGMGTIYVHAWEKWWEHMCMSTQHIEFISQITNTLSMCWILQNSQPYFNCFSQLIFLGFHFSSLPRLPRRIYLLQSCVTALTVMLQHEGEITCRFLFYHFCQEAVWKLKMFF